MEIKKGDYVTRKSYAHDTVFKVINIKNNICYLKGVDVRLYADSPMEDLELSKIRKEDSFFPEIKESKYLDRSEYFYLPGKILHIDGDAEYLTRCLKYYQNANVLAIGKKIREIDIPSKIYTLLQEYRPDVVIITGHDAYVKKNNEVNALANYKNSENFVKAVKEARRYEKSHEKLVIIAGACQSDYEELIKAGANFASSPKRVNIHALDPAIIAVTLAITERNSEIDLPELLEKTKYGKEGMGGIISNGLMYVGYPR